MPGLYPNPSAAPENFRVGEAVRYFINEREISPYVGRVTAICPGIQKVWVEWPIGGNTQMDPENLIKVPIFQGIPTVEVESGYSSFDKDRSKKEYGTMKQEKAIRLAHKIIKEKMSSEERKDKVEELASKVASSFANNVIGKLSSEVIECKGQNLSDIEAYQKIYPKYASTCSDHIIRYAIENIYALTDGE
jgi:hypothetical protein